MSASTVIVAINARLLTLKTSACAEGKIRLSRNNVNAEIQ
jgi:hypothetical protein